MLNRRFLRIRVMQAIYAYKQVKNANEILIWEDMDNIITNEETITSEKKKWEEKKEEIKVCFHKKKEGLADKHPQEDIEDIAKEKFTEYQHQCVKEASYIHKNIIQSVERIDYWHLTVLGLLVAWQKAACSYQKENHKSLINSDIIRALQPFIHSKQKFRHQSLNWSARQHTVQEWFRFIIKKEPAYLQYQHNESPDLEQQQIFIKSIVRKCIFTGNVDDFFATINIHWHEDREIVKSVVEKTLKSFDKTNERVTLQHFTTDWKEDLTFMTTLFYKTLNIDVKEKEMISRQAQRWSTSRFPMIDLILLEMAINELLHFPSIPVKVSMNEYIEIAKRYSTPKSGRFINGMIDAIAKKLQENQAIQKSGRGLIT